MESRRGALLGHRRRLDWISVIVVVGSINLDLVVAVEHHSDAGERLLGGDAARCRAAKGRQPCRSP